MHQDVAQDYNTALIHLMYVFLAKGIILAHFLLLGSDSPGFAREAFWCVSFIATGMELLFYREQQNVVYMGSLVAVSFSDAVTLNYAFYDDFATDKLLLWVTAAVVLSKGFFFRTKPTGEPRDDAYFCSLPIFFLGSLLRSPEGLFTGRGETCGSENELPIAVRDVLFDFVYAFTVFFRVAGWIGVDGGRRRR